MGAQSDHGIGVVKLTDQCRDDLAFGKPSAQTDRSGPGDRGRVGHPPEVARGDAATEGQGHQGQCDTDHTPKVGTGMRAGGKESFLPLVVWPGALLSVLHHARLGFGQRPCVRRTYISSRGRPSALPIRKQEEWLGLAGVTARRTGPFPGLWRTVVEMIKEGNGNSPIIVRIGADLLPCLGSFDVSFRGGESRDSGSLRRQPPPARAKRRDGYRPGAPVDREPRRAHQLRGAARRPRRRSPTPGRP